MAGKKVATKSESNETTSENQAHKLPDPPNALHGWRLHAAVLGLCVGLFCSAIETTIIATSLSTLASHFHDSPRANWIVTAYLVTYSGFLLVFAKLSDIFTQRNVLLFGLSIFALFSGLCAASRSMTQLIVFRAFQGLGGSVIFSLAFVTIMSVCPMRWMGVYSGVAGVVFAVANVLGPLLGGSLGDEGAWQWIFLLNIPAAAVSALLVGAALPGPKTPIKVADLARVDYPGAVFSVGGAVLLVYGLQTGGSAYPWNSSVIIGVLTAAAASVVVFLTWEWQLEAREGRTRMEAIFPFRLLRNPMIAMLLLSAFFLGATFYTAIITLPQRSQLLYGLSATAAGVKLLPWLLVSSFSSAVAGLLYSKSIRLVLPIMVAGAALQVVGAGLLCSLSLKNGQFDSRSYGYEVLLGLSFGFGIPTLMVACRMQLGKDEKDNAVMMGALNMLRTMGGPIALAVCSAIGNVQLPAKLGETLPPEMVSDLLKDPVQAIGELDYTQAISVREEYALVYRFELAAVGGFAALSFICALLAMAIGKRRQQEGGHGTRPTGVDATEKASE